MADGQHGWKDEAQDVMRGVGGAAIIGVPLVYTREVWQISVSGALLGLLLFGFAVCVGYNLFSGFRKGGGITESVKDSVESLAIGTVLAAVLLFLLGIVNAGTPLDAIVYKVVAEAVPFAIGASVANNQFAGGDSDDKGDQKGDPTLREVGVTAAGSLLFAASVAPTEEVAIIALHLSPLGIVAVAAFSLLLSFGMIFVADFTGAQARRNQIGVLQSPFGETVLAYAVALGVSLVCVYYFHSASLSESPLGTVALCVTLALPASVGGAAGRLIV